MLLPEQGQFLTWLIKALQVKQVLAIGTYTGYRSTAMALALSEQGSLISCDNHDKLTQYAKIKVKFYLGRALNTLQDLLLKGQADGFDFIVIDADKENYLAYYELSLQLLKTGRCYYI